MVRQYGDLVLNYRKQIKYPISNSWPWSGSTSVDYCDSKEKNNFILNTVMLFKQHVGWPILDRDLKSFTCIFLKIRFVPRLIKQMLRLHSCGKERGAAHSPCDTVSRGTHRGLEWPTLVCCPNPNCTALNHQAAQETPGQTWTLFQWWRERDECVCL